VLTWRKAAVDGMRSLIYTTISSLEQFIMDNKTMVYKRLAEHISMLAMGFPHTETLEKILEENLKPEEAQAMLAIPNRVIPLQPVSFQEIAQNSDTPEDELRRILENLAERGLIFSGETDDGKTGYAFQQVGFSFPQTFFWKGEKTPEAEKMAGLVSKYFNRKVVTKAYNSDTNAYRYIPVTGTIKTDIQAVLPHHTMESVLEKATDFAVCHCSCRMIAGLRGLPCEHTTEICIKFDEVARYVIDKGLGKKITREKARELVRQAEDEGLVHFVDNAKGDIKHNCNCCGCACWNVGTIRRRKIPRDAIMEVYFTRITDLEECISCEQCADICPVKAVEMSDDRPVVDAQWCIGCGVCATKCPAEAIEMVLRDDFDGTLPAERFNDLQEMILKEKGLK
jgi:Pyruvate/2-oxoacid:ferredoxin oxidoreductase delta subunit